MVRTEKTEDGTMRLVLGPIREENRYHDSYFHQPTFDLQKCKTDSYMVGATAFAGQWALAKDVVFCDELSSANLALAERNMAQASFSAAVGAEMARRRFLTCADPEARQPTPVIFRRTLCKRKPVTATIPKGARGTLNGIYIDQFASSRYGKAYRARVLVDGVQFFVDAIDIEPDTLPDYRAMWVRAQHRAAEIMRAASDTTRNNWAR